MFNKVVSTIMAGLLAAAIAGPVYATPLSEVVVPQLTDPTIADLDQPIDLL